MRVPELAAPEALQVVAACVVESGELLIGEGSLARLAQMVASQRQDVLAIAFQNDRRVRHWEDPMIVLVRLRALEQRDAFERRIDLRGRNPLLVESRLRLLHLQLALRIGQPFLLLEYFLFELRDFPAAVLGIELADPALFRRLRVGEIPLEPARDADRAARQALHHQPLDFGIVHGRAELARQVLDVLRDLRRVTHAWNSSTLRTRSERR